MDKILSRATVRRMENKIHPIKLWCLMNGKTQLELARMSGLNGPYLSQVVKGHKLCGGKAALHLSDATNGDLGVEELLRWGRDGDTA